LGALKQPYTCKGTVYAAAVVGGGSTINGMLFDRGSAEDYDNWEKLGNADWGFSGLLPYFKKVPIHSAGLKRRIHA
jgi:choline dehydrogenase-like flavoprotein